MPRRFRRRALRTDIAPGTKHPNVLRRQYPDSSGRRRGARPSRVVRPGAGQADSQLEQQGRHESRRSHRRPSPGSPPSAQAQAAAQAIANMRIRGKPAVSGPPPPERGILACCPTSASARPSRRSTSRNSTNSRSDEIDSDSKWAVTFLRLRAGRSNGTRLSSVMVGVAHSLPVQKVAGNLLLPNENKLRHDFHHIDAPP